MFHSEPTGRFWQPKGSKKDDEDEEELEGERETPRKLGFDEAEQICTNSQSLLELSWRRCLQVIQHDIVRPPILMTINAIPVRPRLAVLLVSAAHTGAVAVFMPFPIPAMTLRMLSHGISRGRGGICSPSCRHHSKVERKELQEGANHHDSRPQQDRSFSTDPVPDWARCQCPDQAA